MDAQKTNIEISDLRVTACIGCTPEERSKTRELFIDIAVYFDAQKSIRSDQLSDTIDYKVIAELIKEICEKNAPVLLEKLAWNISDKIYKEMPLAKEINLAIKKRYAVTEAHSAGFRLTTKR